jgi:alkanesulfonate monooxygenase
VFPLLPLKATTGHGRGLPRNAGPFGEIVANATAPVALDRAAAG